MLLSKILFQITLIYLFLYAVTVCGRDIYTKDFTIEKILYFNESALRPVQMKLYTKRIDRSPQMFIDLNLTDDPRQYDMEIKIYFSLLGNRQYISIPYAVRRKPWCDLLNTAYRERIMRYTEDISNFPFTKDPKVDICDLFPVGAYYLKGAKNQISGKPYIIPDGLYRSEILIYKKKKPEIDFGLLLVTRIFS